MNDGIFSDDTEVRLAPKNYEAQERRAASLLQAFQVSGKTYEDVATDLKMSTEVAQEIIKGHYNLTLGEMRLVALSLNVNIGYIISAEPVIEDSPEEKLDTIIREAFRDRGNRVPDWDADETEAYRSHGGFQSGMDAVTDIRVQKIKNLLVESGLLK